VRFAGFQRHLIVALCGVAFATLFPHHSSAQAVSYYDFNTPYANSSQASTSCGTISGGPAVSGVLFCFNYTGSGLSYIQDFYPPLIDPNASTDSDAGSTNDALQLTQSSGSQDSSMWYSIPQNVEDGFDAWYAVKLTPSASSTFTADGLAFVIQNSAGTPPLTKDPITSCTETGSGFTVLGEGGGGIGYCGIDNSVALEMDTFWDSPYDPEDFAHGYAYDDNHLALQSCGPGQQNSVAHLGTPNCLITLGGTSTLVSNPNTSAAPPATASAVTLSDGAPHQIVVVYNGPNDSPKNYLYVYLDPAFNAGTHTPVAGSTPLFSGTFDIANYINLNNGTAYVGFTAGTGGSFEQHELMGFTFTPHGYGYANVCPSGQTTPAPCSSTVPVTFTVPTAAIYGTPQVVTQGAAGLDFQLGSGSTCSGAMIVGESCTVNVTFAPLAPGLRMGAVNLLDISGNVLATRLVYGTGQGPAIAFGPGTQSTVNTTGSYPLNQPKGVAVDAAGDVFIADTGNQRVVKFAANGTMTTVGFNLQYPQGLAVDGAGDLFIADNNINSGEVLEVPAGCTNSNCQKVLISDQTSVSGATTARSELGVAVDGVGDVFFSDFLDGYVAEIPANGSTPTVVYNPGPDYKPGFSPNPVGLAVDAAGDLFVADFGLKEVLEIPSGCTNSGCWSPVGTGWVEPEAAAVDAAGDVFVADEAPKVVEVPAGCTLSTCQITVSGILAYGVAVDGTGNVYIPDLDSLISVPDSDSNQVVVINRSQTPSLSFASTNVGSTSSDSPQSLTIQNIGNRTLSAISPGLAVSGPNFIQAPGASALADCSATFSLTQGASCNLSISFKPQSAGNPLSSAAVFTDNNLNAISSSPAATQSVALSGVGVSVTYTVGGSVTGLAGSGLVLQDNLGDNLSISANGSFTFATALSTGSPYSVTVLSSPIAQNCAVSDGGGTVANANITNVLVTCTTIPSYGLSVTEIGSGSGTVTSSLGAISCNETNGSVTGTCSDSYLSGSPVTLTANATGTSTFLGWGGACAASGTSPTCNVSVISVLNATASFVQQSFGNVNVCPSGQTAPAPCSGTLTLTYNLAATTTIGVIQVVTQGINGLDFSLGSGSTCTGTIAEGFSCTVNVNFAPLAPGLRTGAVRLFDNGGNLLATTPIYGIGQAPAIAFGPGTQTTVASGLAGASGAAVDAAGDVFISDNAGAVKVTPSGVQSTEPTSGLSGVYDVAVDGAGDVFLADTGNNRVVEVTPSGVQTTVPATGLSAPTGVAVDGSGDVFITDVNNNRVVKVTPSGVQTTVPTSGVIRPFYPAVDGAGDVFFLDSGNERVLKVTPGGVQSTIPISGLASGNGVAVDAAGDVFITDQINNVVLEVTPSGVQTTLPTTGLNVPAGLAVDAAGDVFIAVNGQNRAVEVNRSQLPSLSFALTNVSSTSTDSPQLVSIQNVGNQTLTGSLALSLGTNFGENGSSTCGSGFSLIPGASCSESFSFTPQSTGYLTGTAAFSDNTFNLSPLVVLQTVNLSGNGGLNGQAVGVAVPNVVGLTQAAATTALTSAGLTLGTVSTASSSIVPSGSVSDENPAAGTQVSVGSAVRLLVSTGQAPPPTPNPLSFENNYFVTGDFASAGVSLRGTGVGGIATGTITIPDSTTSPGVSQGVPDGADIIDAFLYWGTLESTPSPSASSGTFLGYPITGQQIGSDLPNYTDGTFTGTLRMYRADVNTYFPIGANGVRFASGAFTVSLPDSGGTALPLTEGASLVVIYRVLSQNFPLKAVVIYDGSTIPTTSTTQNMQGFYDAAGTGENTTLFAAGGSWTNSSSSIALPAHTNQFSASLNSGDAYAAVILSTPVNNSDSDAILDAWKAGPLAGDFHAGQPGYYDVKTGSWVPLPGAKHGEKDLFVQLDYMCGAVLPNGACDPSQENLFPSPDAQGNDPLAMVTSAFAADGIVLHLGIGNAVPESTCTDNLTTSPPQLCQFPSEPGVIGWKNSLEFSKLWPRNLASCAAGGDCTTRFPYGQKDSYHYVLFGHSLAIPAWNSRYGSLTSIQVLSGVTTIVTTDRGNGINYCPSRITISGVLGNPTLNGVYNTTSCADAKTITVATPGVPNWSYPNTTLPEPVIGLTSGTVTSISGYSDLGGADSAVTLGLWETAPNQNMSKRANVIAGTLFHEIGHTLGLGHGGLYYDGPSGSYVPTFDVNCKPNYQSVMNYLFQLDGVGPNAAVAYSNQQLDGESLSGPPATILSLSSLGSVAQLTDASGNPATFPTSAWYTPNAPSTTASAATLHCDGTPLNGDAGYRVNGTIAPIAPAWSSGQNITFDGVPYTQLRGYNDLANIDLHQVGATGGEFASLATVLSFGASQAPLNVAAGGNVTLGSGGTIALGSGGNVTLGSGGNVTLGSGGTITLGSGGNVTLGSGGNVTLGSGGTITPGAGGNVTLGSGGNVTLGSGGTITLGSGGNVTLGSGGTVTLGSGGTIALGSGGTVTIPSTGGSYTIDSSGGTITLGSGGNVTLGSGGNVTLGSGGTIALGSGGNVTLGSGGNVTLGSGGTIALGSGGTVTLGSGGNVTLGSGGTVTLGSGGNVTLGSGGNVTLGSGGTVTLGSGGDVSVGSGGNVTLGSGGTVTLGSGGTVTLGSGGNVTLGSGGNVTLGSGGTITMGSGGNVTLGSGGNVTLGSGGDTITLGSGGNVTLGSGGNVTLGSGGTITLAGGGGTVVLGAGGSYTIPASGGTVTLGSGGNVTLGSGGNVTLGSGGTIALGSGGNVTLGSGGNVTLGSGGTITLGSGGNVTLGSGGTVTLGSGGNVTLGSGGVVALGSGGNVTLGSGGTVALGSGGNITLGSGGATTNEMDYVTANSVVRPPSSPTETPQSTSPGAPVVVNWTAPAFGVVATYTISRGSEAYAPFVIGSVSGQNGNPPATTFTDTNPDLTSHTVVYTISTTLLPVPIDPSPGQSAPSPPAVLTNNQTIVLGPPALPSSVSISTSPLTVYATAESNGAANGLQVSFSAISATGSCSIASQSPPDSNGASSASVALNSAGSCTITASQPGTNLSQPGNPPFYNAANSVSGTFTILPQGSNTQSQTINFPQLPNVQYGSTFSLSASSSSGLPVSFTASGPCTTSGSTTGVGPCKIMASTPAGTVGSNTYSAASGSQSFTIYPAVLTVTAKNITGTYGESSLPPLTYTTSPLVNGDPSTAVTGAPSLSTTATTASNAGNYPITVSTGTLAAANYSFLFVSGTLTIQPVSQTITFTANAPASAAYNSSFTVGATGGGSGNPVTFTSSGVCSITGTTPGTATYTMTNSTGACSVIANQAGNTNYSVAPTVTQTVNANGPLVTVSPSNINFGTVNLGSITTKNITVTNIGTAPITINQPLISIVQGGNSNEFVAVSLCPASLAAGNNCTITITFVAGPFYTPQTATLEIMDNAPGSPQPVTLSATVLAPQTITFTTNPPGSAAYNSSFTVAATGGGSGNAVTFTSSGACTNSGATYKMTSSTGTCSVIANQAGNSNYAAAAQVTKTVSATLATQTITFTTNPPASAAYNSSFTVAATGGGSGNAVTFTSSGACSNSGATYKMTGSTGTCSVIANQAGNSTYAAAAQVTKTVSATLATQTITFTTNPPASAAYKSSFTVAATGGGSGNAVTFTNSGVCSHSGAIYTMTSGTGTCSVIANQAGNTNYAAAAQVTKTVTATLVAQTITFTTNPPATAAYKSTFKVAATNGGSGNAVTFTSSGACSNSGATYTMTSGTGTCSVIANQAGNSNYAAAPQVTKTVTAKQ
jgi:sugar lactone lactonase YvrE/phosphotransferase system HPr-like phosphotransfer protein